MPSSYTTSLRLTLPATGELAGQWGNTVNTGITELLDAAVAGTTTISTWGGAGVAYTLSNNSGTADEARRMFIVATGTPGEAKNVICPAVSKFYVFRNDTTGGFALTLKTFSGTGVSVPAGQYKFLYCDGTNVVEMFNSAGALTLSGALSVGGTATFAANPTLSAGTANQVQFLNASKVLTGSANMTFNGTDLTVSGAVNAATVNATTLDLTNIEVTNIKAKDGTASMTLADATGVATFSANPILNAGTANGVLYLNGSKVATSGSALTFDGTIITQTASTPVFGLWESASGNFNRLLITQSAGLATYNLTYSTLGTVAQVWQLGSSEQMRLTSTGLGIGTISPLQKLQVKGIIAAENGGIDGTYADQMYFMAAGYPGTQQHRIRGSTSAVAANNLFCFESSTATAGVYNTNQLVLSGDSSVSFKNGAMRLDSSGNLGIGTSSPAVKLDVNGALNLAIGNNLTWGGAYGAGTPTIAGSSTGGGTLLFYPSGSTSGERMRLDSSGNLGLGVMPSAWTTTAGIEAFQVSSRAALWGDTTQTILSNNIYASSTGDRYIENGFSSLYTQISGQHRWLTAPSGTAGAAISFTQAMTLDASGNLLLGTTSRLVNYGHEIVVNGTAGEPEGFVAIRGERTADGNLGALKFYNYSNSMGGISARRSGADNSSALIFSTSNAGSDTERARITSGGDLLVGCTSTAFATATHTALYLTNTTGGSGGLRIKNTSNNTGTKVATFFGWDDTETGSISTYVNVTTYTTSSDYRLKTLIAPVTGSGARLDALNPVEFEWKADGKRARGFFAHEFQQVYSGSVVGEKDEVDADGKPVYQAMQASTSEVIADLVAELQSLRARVAALEGV